MNYTQEKHEKFLKKSESHINQGDCHMYMGSIAQKLISLGEKPHFNVNHVSVEGDICDPGKASSIVNQIRAKSRTAIFCMDQFEYRSILEEIDSTIGWNLIYLDLTKDYTRDSCMLWSNHRGGSFRKVETRIVDIN